MTRFYLGLLIAAYIASASTVSAQTVYVMDKTHSTVRGCWSHFGVTSQCVYFTSAEGELVFDESTPENSKLTITFPLDKLESLSSLFNEHLRSDQWFDIKNILPPNSPAQKLKN
ncbi:MAG: YceI family protein [Hyphomicrobiales bacterium]|nr:YceI family protein [Hyphomicrobiales bacterium]